MIRTHGITHISLAVADKERSFRFYHEMFGVEEYFRDEASIHATTPGSHDVITFTEHAEHTGERGGIIHFGFRLLSPDDIDAAVAQIESAGGALLSRGEFSPGYPHAYVSDPDGYEVEIWYE